MFIQEKRSYVGNGGPCQLLPEGLGWGSKPKRKLLPRVLNASGPEAKTQRQPKGEARSLGTQPSPRWAQTPRQTIRTTG